MLKEFVIVINIELKHVKTAMLTKAAFRKTMTVFQSEASQLRLVGLAR